MAAGLDAIGVAASIIQLADFGAQLSIKLYTFYHQVKTADERLNSLSSNVSLTCNVLKQLAENLEQDDQARLYSHEAFNTAKQVSADCDVIFKKIDGALNRYNYGLVKSSFQRVAAKVGFVFMENDINVLRRDLERLKATMLLLLNVVMYAGQIRSRAESKALKEQSDLIQSLIEQRQTNEPVVAFNKIMYDTVSSVIDDTHRFARSASVEFRSYCSLVERILHDIDAIKSTLEPDQCQRVRNAILLIHSDEIARYEQANGKDTGRDFRRFNNFRHCSRNKIASEPCSLKSPSLPRFTIPASLSHDPCSPLPELNTPTDSALSSLAWALRMHEEPADKASGCQKETSTDGDGHLQPSTAQGPGCSTPTEPHLAASERNLSLDDPYYASRSLRQLDKTISSPVSYGAPTAAELSDYSPRRFDFHQGQTRLELAPLNSHPTRGRPGGKRVLTESENRFEEEGSDAKRRRRSSGTHESTKPTSDSLSSLESIVLAWTTLERHEFHHDQTVSS